MYIGPKDHEFVVNNKMRGGKGDVYMEHIGVAGKNLPSSYRIFAQINIPVGASIGEHMHEKESEIYYILKGHGTVNDSGKMVQVGVGDTIVTDNDFHSIENTGDEELSMIAIVVYDKA